MILVVGSGGNGQTYFMNFLRKNNITTNHPDDDDGLKHLSHPNKLGDIKVEKCIFLYNHPYNSLLSHYRRGWAKLQCDKLGNPFFLNPDQIENYNTMRGLIIQHDQDMFGIEYQFENWTNEGVKFPILFLDFRHILDRKQLLDKYLNTELNYKIFEVGNRTSYAKDNDMQFIYEELYQHMMEKISSLSKKNCIEFFSDHS